MIVYAFISGAIPGRCGNCRAATVLRWFDVVRRVATWVTGGHFLYCDDCVNEYVTLNSGKQSVIRDERESYV